MCVHVCMCVCACVGVCVCWCACERGWWAPIRIISPWKQTLQPQTPHNKLLQVCKGLGYLLTVLRGGLVNRTLGAGEVASPEELPPRHATARGAEGLGLGAYFLPDNSRWQPQQDIE